MSDTPSNGCVAASRVGDLLEAHPSWTIVVPDVASSKLLNASGLRAFVVGDAALAGIGPGAEVLLVGAHPLELPAYLRSRGAIVWHAALPATARTIEDLLDAAHRAMDRAPMSGADVRDLFGALIVDQAQPLDGERSPTNGTAPQHSAARTVPPLRLYSPHELATLPPRTWTWHRLLGAGDLGLLLGGWGSYKSFVAVGLAVATIDGTEFLGRRAGPGHVVLLVGEGSGGIAGRIRAAASCARVIDLTDPLQQRLHIAAEMPAIGTLTGWDRAVAAIDALPEQPKLAVIDTWARFNGVHAADENSSLDAGRLVDACDRLRARYAGMALWVLHHTPNDRADRARGSSVLPSAADFQARLVADSRPGVLEAKFEVDKLKDGKRPAKMVVELAEVVVGTDPDDGQPVTSLRVSGFRTATPSATGDAPQNPAQADLERVRRELASGPRSGPDLVGLMSCVKSTAYERLRRWSVAGAITFDTTTSTYRNGGAS